MWATIPPHPSPPPKPKATPDIPACLPVPPPPTMNEIESFLHSLPGPDKPPEGSFYDIKGLTQEIALLRVKLNAFLADQKSPPELPLQTITSSAKNPAVLASCLPHLSAPVTTPDSHSFPGIFETNPRLNSPLSGTIRFLKRIPHSPLSPTLSGEGRQ